MMDENILLLTFLKFLKISKKKFSRFLIITYSYILIDSFFRSKRVTSRQNEATNTRAEW